MFSKTALSILLSGGLLFTACQSKKATDDKTTAESAATATTSIASDTMATSTGPVAAPTATDGEMCFFKALNRDTTTVSLTVTGDKVTGSMVWNPYQKDGARGTLAGTKKANGELDLMYSYTIEGSQQTETKLMKVENGVLLIKKGPLMDPKEDGNLRYKDAAKATYSEKLEKTDCANVR